MQTQMNADKRRYLLGLCVGAMLLLAAAALGAQKKERPAKPLDVNTATAEELRQLPEVGEKLAAAIVRFREKSGPFKRVEELLAVPGITKRRLEKLRPFVFVGTAKTGDASAVKQPTLAQTRARVGHPKGLPKSKLAEVALDLHHGERDGGGDDLNGDEGLGKRPRSGAGCSQPQQFSGDVACVAHSRW